MVDVRLMQAAVVLAEELRFSRAAIRLGITQSALTRQIQDLEERVGRKLFHRNRQVVEVTEAGRAFVEDARRSLQYADRAVNSARSRSESAEAFLRLGKSPYADPFLVSTLLSVRLPLYPQLKLALSSNFSSNLAHEVLSGSIDVALLSGPEEPAGLTCTQLDASSMFVVLNSTDHLAGQKEVSLGDVHGREWILFERHVNPAMYDRFQKVAAIVQAIPRDVQHVTTAEEALPLIADLQGIAVLTRAGAWRVAQDGFTMRPITDEALRLITFLAARPDEGSRIVSEFVRGVVKKLQAVQRPRPENLPLSG